MCAATALDKVIKEQLTFPKGALITAIIKSMGVPTMRSACAEEKNLHTHHTKDPGKDTFTFCKQHKDTTLRQPGTLCCSTQCPPQPLRAGTPCHSPNA